MATKVISVTPDIRVKNCMVLMTEHHIRHLPVFKDKDLFGVISIGDVDKDVIDEVNTKINMLEKYIAGSLS
jgi:CBS domain-containing protein